MLSVQTDCAPVMRTDNAYVGVENDALPTTTCPFCSVTFSRKAKLKKHIETMHSKPLHSTKTKANIEPIKPQDRSCDRRVSKAEKRLEVVELAELSSDIQVEHAVDMHELQQNGEKLLDVSRPVADNEPNNITYHEEYLDQSIDDEFRTQDDLVDTVDELAPDPVAEELGKDTAKRIQKPNANQRVVRKKSKAVKRAPMSQSAQPESGDQLECNECGKSFTRITHLKRHKLTHSDERPFHCDICEKRFRRADHLREYPPFKLIF